MKFETLVQNLVKFRFAFECNWFEGLNTYGINIVLGNREFLIPWDNENELAELWEEIEKYWLY